MFQRSVLPPSGSESNKPRKKPTRSSLQAQQTACRNPGDDRLVDYSQIQSEHTSVASADYMVLYDRTLSSYCYEKLKSKSLEVKLWNTDSIDKQFAEICVSVCHPSLMSRVYNQGLNRGKEKYLTIASTNFFLFLSFYW